ncbi:PREDICTED: uncharacterized protein At2g33490 isoform X2 [Nicotiana attenuata]|uniref:BAR domain-containing protein n=1 Tax=Nicotiana attenuata TaxID=49451 RepID=A0A1J6J5Z3_NICAT|nr:PREDICTED: uncharacterized protein At2g33490 isoform X1 [Nicotiana attenuata]XP_019247209.1 PREDICTED: uncharacterized protein At2g33490 isoform X1 [Nicotiana attenuata]XP_019247217.1 PREDICTED: uncharacterized protein At2g33490 isoform X2 [Nicotiana attenuata]OIT08088.1 uncharacterized protein A4A49_05830 [Nicotiana attenuata]
MKTSLKKLRGLANLRHDKKERRLRQPSDELALAAQDMEEMKDCYDRLLSAAAATANGAYEFSESLREMGDCLLEKTALNDDEESGKVLLMLGKMQFQLQRLVDNYRSHIIRTIAVPSESLLNELRIVEEMKLQCDNKREVYEQTVQKYRDKGRIKGTKGECISSHQLKVAYEEYDEGATVFVFRMKSLKQGQSRSLLTQAARHHAAQLSFFKKAVKSLEEIEPHVKLVTELHHIDYHFHGLEEDDGDDAGNEDDDENDYDDDSDDGSESLDDGELSFDYGQNDQVNPSTHLMELDKVDVTVPEAATKGASKENLNKSYGGNSFSFFRDVNSTKSAPLLSGRKQDPAEGGATRMTSSLSNKFQPYVLPTPVEAKTTDSVKSYSVHPQTRRTGQTATVLHSWHSSPLDQFKHEKLVADEKLSGPITSNTQSVLTESNNYAKSGPLPPPLSEGLSSLQHDWSNAKKVKRQAFSGPLTAKPWPKKPAVSAGSPIASTGYPQHFSLPFLHTSTPEPSSAPKLSSRTSPPLMSSPKISELHELPRPPANLASKRPPRQIAHSGPLVSKVQELSSTNKVAVSSAASTLPTPPALPRSYSIPSRGQIETAFHVSKPLEDMASPPLTPIAFGNIQHSPPAS